MIRLLHHLILVLSVIAGCLSPAAFAQQPSAQQQTLSTAQWLEQGKILGRNLSAGQTHTYKIKLGKGEFLDALVVQHSLDVVVRIFGPAGTRITEIDSPNGDQGEEPILFKAKTPGIYQIDISPRKKNARPGRYEFSINELVSAPVHAARVAETIRKQKSVIGWLKRNVIPLKTVEAGADFSDLQPLKRTFRDVRFVGLGEATHGSREFFQVKHRLLEFLVREMGFRVFAIEGSYAALQRINAYVLGNTDDGAQALDSQGFWTWNTEEIRAMMDWARTYNMSVADSARVKFAGFDNQFNQYGKDRLLDYLRRVAPERTDTTASFFRTDPDSLSSALGTVDQQKEMRETLNELQANYNNLFGFLDLNGWALAAKSSQVEYEQMHDYARVLTQYMGSYSQPIAAGVSMRDVHMAANFQRLVEREPAGTRFVLWAHNGHIAADTSVFFRPMGFYLRQVYGKDYYALGLSFNKGSFQAQEAQPNDSGRRMLMTFTAHPAPEGSIDWYLAQTGRKLFITDFRADAKNADLSNWLTTPSPMRSIGSVYTPAGESYFFYPISVGQRFDGLLFVDTTTRARPNPSVRNVAGRTGQEKVKPLHISKTKHP